MKLNMQLLQFTVARKSRRLTDKSAIQPAISASRRFAMQPQATATQRLTAKCAISKRALIGRAIFAGTLTCDAAIASADWGGWPLFAEGLPRNRCAALARNRYLICVAPGPGLVPAGKSSGLSLCAV